MKITIGAPKVLGIQIDSEITHVVEMEYLSKVPKIYSSFSIHTPTEMFSSEGILVENEEFRRSFTEACAVNRVLPDRVAFTICSARIINREIIIPYIKESKIESLIYENATDYFPVNLNEYKLIYNIVGNVENDNAKQIKLIVCAVPRDIIKSYYSLAEFLGLNIVAIDYIGNGLIQTLKATNRDLAKQTSDVTNMYISINSKSTLLTFVRNGAVQMQRVIGVGISDVTDNIRTILDTNTGDIRVCDVLHSIRDNPYFLPSFNNSSTSVKTDAKRGGAFPAELLTENTELIKPLVSAILRSIEYYKSMPGNNDHAIAGCIVGSAVLFTGIEELFENELGIEFKHMHISADKKLVYDANDPNFSFDEFYACIGACTSPVNLANKVRAKQYSVVELFNDPSFQNTLLGIGFVCFAVCIALSVCFLFIPLAENSAVRTEENRCVTELTTLSNARAPYTEYVNMQSMYDSVTKVDDYLTTYNDNIILFIEEFEEKMPNTFSAASFSVSDTGVAMTINVASKQQAAYVIMELRKFTYSSLASISNITDQESIIGYSADPYLNDDGSFNRTKLAAAYSNYTDAQLISQLENGIIDPLTLYADRVVSQTGMVLNPLLTAAGVTEDDVDYYMDLYDAVMGGDYSGIDFTDPKVIAVYNLYTTGQISQSNIYVQSNGYTEQPITDIEVVTLTENSVSFSVSMQFNDILLNPDAENDNSDADTSDVSN